MANSVLRHIHAPAALQLGCVTTSAYCLGAYVAAKPVRIGRGERSQSSPGAVLRTHSAIVLLK